MKIHDSLNDTTPSIYYNVITPPSALPTPPPKKTAAKETKQHEEAWFGMPTCEHSSLLNPFRHNQSEGLFVGWRSRFYVDLSVLD